MYLNIWGLVVVYYEFRQRCASADLVLCMRGYFHFLQMVATTVDTRQDVQEVSAGAFSRDRGYLGGSVSTSSRKASFHGDPQMTNKVAVMSDGSRTITMVPTSLTNKKACLSYSFGRTLTSLRGRRQVYSAYQGR